MGGFICFRSFLGALVAQPAEAADSKPVQCGFDSHRGHWSRVVSVAARPAVNREGQVRVLAREPEQGTQPRTQPRTVRWPPGSHKPGPPGSTPGCATDD